MEVLNSKLKKRIKQYVQRRFGSKTYWPYVALYTEIKGEFKDGWLPYDYYRFSLLPRLNPKPAMYFSTYKTFDYRIFGDFVVKPLFICIHGIFFDIKMEVFIQEEVRNFMIDYDNKIVIKEDGGRGGKQIKIIHSSFFKLEELDRTKSYLIQPYFKQHKVLNDLYPDSVNTFRINTFLNKNGSVSVKYIWLHFGTDGSQVDNLSSGGSYLFFDSLGIPEEFAYDWQLGFKVSDRHKNTNYKFADLQIPNFEKMLSKCKEAHLKFPYTRLIAWDCCIDTLGEPYLIEWNTTNPDFKSQEAKFGPFWPKDEIF